LAAPSYESWADWPDTGGTVGKLALPLSDLPSGTSLEDSGISNNHDADGTTALHGGITAQMAITYQPSYEALGRINEYRMDFTYVLQGVGVGTEYLASIFTASLAAAAMPDAQGGVVITFVTRPLGSCSVGNGCHT
jgi:hypothetical protein